jgi:hypothetical protein
LLFVVKKSKRIPKGGRCDISREVASAAHQDFLPLRGRGNPRVLCHETKEEIPSILRRPTVDVIRNHQRMLVEVFVIGGPEETTASKLEDPRGL